MLLIWVDCSIQVSFWGRRRICKYHKKFEHGKIYKDDLMSVLQVRVNNDQVLIVTGPAKIGHVGT